MYCPVYGCNSDSKMTKEVRFFFSNHQIIKTEKKARIEFCKRKAFKPLSNTRICSLHLTEDTFEPGQLSQFL